MTTYILLRRTDTGWEHVGTEKAAGPRAALRQLHALQAFDGAHAYAAVPERNWTELTPELVTETRLVFR